MQNPSIMSHVSIGTNQLDKALAFYDAVLATIGAVRTLDLSEHGAVAYGREYPEFWVQMPHNGQVATVGNGAHFSFYAQDTQAVHAFYEAAMAHGATDDGAPGPREHYGEEYYGCFVRDLDGNKIEAMTMVVVNK